MRKLGSQSGGGSQSPRRSRKKAPGSRAQPRRELPVERSQSEAQPDDSEGFSWWAVVEVASPENDRVRKRDPDVEVVDRPSAGIVGVGRRPSIDAPFRLSVAELGFAIVDPTRGLVAPEGKRAADAIKRSGHLRIRAEKQLIRIAAALELNVQGQWKWGKPRREPPITCPTPEIDDTNGMKFVALVEAGSPRNAWLKRRNPTIDVADLPDISFVSAGWERETGMPFRLNVPDLGSVIVDPKQFTLATEGTNTRTVLKERPELRERAEKHAARIVGLPAWRWAKPRPDPRLTARDKRFIEFLIDRAIEQWRAEHG